MFRSYRRTCIAAALLPLFLGVDVAAAPAADPTSATATVTPQPYESVFKNYRSASDETTSPDKLWRDANAAVAGQGGHAGMAGMTTDGSMSMPASGEKSMPMDMKMPMDHTMKMPAGNAKSMDQTMPMPEKAPKDAPAPAAPMPPGMNMHEGHTGK